MFPARFRFIWPSGFRGEEVFLIANQKQEFPVAAMFVNRSGQMSILYRGPSIDVSYQVSVPLATQFQRRRFSKIGQSEKRIAFGGHVCKWIETKCVIFGEDRP
jgi:hypothetical protein